MIRTALALALATASLAALPSSYAAPASEPDDLRAAARVNGMSVAELREVLEDPAMHLDDGGALFVADVLAEPDHAHHAAMEPARAVAPLADTFRLHSRPGSQRTVYLDFDGVTLAPTNRWVTQLNWPAGSYDGYDTDGDPSAFGTEERTAVQEVWARVSEDFAPFDVDVTTEEPAVGLLHRSDLRFTCGRSRVDPARMPPGQDKQNQQHNDRLVITLSSHVILLQCYPYI